ATPGSRSPGPSGLPRPRHGELFRPGCGAGATPLLGGAVVRQTGVDPAVAVVVEQQADPYREQQTSARIVRAVNAYDDLCGEGVKGSLRALEQLRLGTGRDYQPQVVEALARVLARGGPAPAGAG
ncbi:hypothetical protein AB0D13_25635, partial [Streptomyces sp. NPDC048430]